MNTWTDYPMGPELRSFLDIADSEYTGGNHTEISPERQKEFEDFLAEFTVDHPVESGDTLSMIIPELVLMRHASAAIAISERYIELVDPSNFALLLSIGSAYMIVADYATSEKYFESAQELHPEELSPYANMVQILYLQQKDQELQKWIDSGLDVDANSRQIWEIYASYQSEVDADNLAKNLKEYAKSKHSWAGHSLAFQVEAPDDPRFRAEQLEDLYKAGETAEEFLIELTAALGVSEQYEKIPPIIWKAEQLQDDSQKLSWQLYAHAAQAQLGMEKKDEAKILLEKSLQDERMDPQVQGEISALLNEIIEDQKPTVEH